MSYLHISNLYKDQTILLFKKCYAMEKIHGTSAHIMYKKDDKRTTYFSGGEKQENFEKIFNKELIQKKFEELNINATIYGEAYGGKCQAMSATYGKELKFVAFEVRIDNNWLSVPQAEAFTKNMGLEFVHYDEIETDVNIIEKLASSESIQAIRNGMGNGKEREGIVLRPLIEMTLNNRDRVIAKQKNPKYRERIKQVKIRNKEELEILIKSGEIADEWVTDVRLSHVLDKFPNAQISDTPLVIKAMIEDIYREAKDEIKESESAKRAIAKKTANMFKERIRKVVQ